MIFVFLGNLTRYRQQQPSMYATLLVIAVVGCCLLLLRTKLLSAGRMLLGCWRAKLKYQASTIPGPPAASNILGELCCHSFGPRTLQLHCSSSGTMHARNRHPACCSTAFVTMLKLGATFWLQSSACKRTAWRCNQFQELTHIRMCSRCIGTAAHACSVLPQPDSNQGEITCRKLVRSCFSALTLVQQSSADSAILSPTT